MEEFLSPGEISAGGVELLRLTSIHESGHVIIAYNLGFNCSCITLKSNNPGKGESKIDWNEYTPIIASLQNPEVFPEIYNNVPSTDIDYLKSFRLLAQNIKPILSQNYK